MLGEGSPDKAKHFAKIACSLVVAVSMVTLIISYAFRWQIAAVYSTTIMVRERTVEAIPAFLVVVLFDHLNGSMRAQITGMGN